MTRFRESSGLQELQLDELLNGITYEESTGIRVGETIHTLTSDSREVLPGSLFVAVRGYCRDGHHYIGSAVERGAVAVICEEFPHDIGSTCLFIKVSDARKALAEAARIFYGKASDQLLIIGVTGTNGKTTTSRLITAMLNATGTPSGYIGTNLCMIGEREIALERTTPEANGLHSLFSHG